MTLYPHPHTIEDAGSSRMTFLDQDGDRLYVKSVVRPGGGPPMHVHHLQDEVITVESGEVTYQVAGEEPVTAGPGETVSFARGVAHRFWNSGDTDLVAGGYITPPLNVEYFLTQIYDSSRRAGGKRPSAFDAAWLLRRYRSEFAMTDIPAPVQRFVFPIQTAIGKLLGRYRRFDGAPAPVRG